MNGVLPDVNLLLALAWPNHQFHDHARSWFGRQSGPWFTCSVTQLGFVRLSSNPAFTRYAKTPLEATLLLNAMTAQPGHEFLADSETIGQCLRSIAPRLQGHRQLTDAYLVAIAHERAVQLVTFDRKIAAFCPFGEVVLVLPDEC